LRLGEIGIESRQYPEAAASAFLPGRRPPGRMVGAGRGSS